MKMQKLDNIAESVFYRFWLLITFFFRFRVLLGTKCTDCTVWFIKWQSQKFFTFWCDSLWDKWIIAETIVWKWHNSLIVKRIMELDKRMDKWISLDIKKLFFKYLMWVFHWTINTHKYFQYLLAIQSAYQKRCNKQN